MMRTFALAIVLGTFISTLSVYAKDTVAKITCVTSSCHSAIDKFANVHQPTKIHNCEVCHTVVDKRPEDSKFPEAHPLVRVNMGDDPTKGCLGCHTKWGSDFKSKKKVHTALEGDSCLGCHNPHGSEFPKFLRTTMDEAQLCIGCHADKEAWKTDPNFKEHKITHINKGCINCHNPHSSNSPVLLLREGRKLCLGCHSKAIQTQDGRTLKSFAHELGKGRTIHSPVDGDEDCMTCHQPHGSTFRKLLKDDVGENYDEFSEKKYALCFTCHSAELVTTAKTPDATEFRNGEMNLHNFHVIATPKNRACGTCHEIHSSSNPKLIKEQLAYNDYKLPLTFTKTANGGSCTTACHGLKVYDRKTPFANSKGR